MKKGDLYIITSERYNPQLGSYPYELLIGKVKSIGKTQVTVAAEKYGEAITMHFTHDGQCKDKDGSIYGSVCYSGWGSDKVGASAWLKSYYPTHYKTNGWLETISKA